MTIVYVSYSQLFCQRKSYECMKLPANSNDMKRNKKKKYILYTMSINAHSLNINLVI